MVIMMIDKLKQEEKRTQELIKEWEEYSASNKKHYNIPLPYEIKEMARIYYRIYDNKTDVPMLKGKLAYFNVVYDYYECNDYVVDLMHCENNFESENDIKKVKITESHREIIANIINGIEQEIERKEALK